MKKIINHGLIILIWVSLNFTACKKTDRIPAVAANTPPVAHAGVDQTVILPVDYTFLDGAGSSDRDNNITGCLWKLVSGPSTNIIITTPYELRTRISNLVKGNYLFELTVADNVGPNSKDTVQVSVIEPNYSNSEIIFRDQPWNYSWIKEIDLNNILSYLPPNSFFKNIFIKRDYSTEWELVVPLNKLNPSYNRYTYDFGNNILAIYPDGSPGFKIDDAPDIKIEY
jgi:hypothetical protein